MKKSMVRVGVFAFVIAVAIGVYWLYTRALESKQSRSSPAVMLLTDVNGDGKKDTIVVYDHHNKSNVLEAFDEKGKLLWVQETKNVIAADQHSYAPAPRHAVTNTHFFLSHREFRIEGKYWITARSKKKGELVWRHTFDAGEEFFLYTKIVVVEGRILLFTASRKGKHREYLTALDEKTGKVQWRRELKALYPRAPWFTGSFVFVYGSSTVEKSTISSGKTVTIRSSGQILLRGGLCWYVSYNKPEKRFELARYNPKTETSEVIKAGDEAVVFPRGASVYGGWGLYKQHVFVFSGKGIYKDVLSFLPIVKGEKASKIVFADGYGFSTIFTDWRKRAPLYAPLLQGDVRYVPLTLKKKLDKKQVLHKLVLLDLQERRIVWRSKPYKGYSLSLLFHHIFYKDGRYYLHLPFRWKGPKSSRALVIMDGRTGKFLSAHVLQWKWTSTQEDWHTGCPKARPWWMSYPQQIGMFGALRWRVDVEQGVFSLRYPEESRWVDVRKALEKSWGTLR